MRSKALFGGAEHFRGDADAGDVERRIEHVRALPLFADERVRRHPRAVELDVRGVAAVHHLGARHPHPVRLPIHQEQRNAVAFSGGSRGAGGHDEAIRHMAVEHELLAAAQDVAVTRLLRGGGHAVRAMAVGLLQRERQQQLARRHFGQQRGLLRRAAAEVQYGAAHPTRWRRGGWR